MAVAKLMLTANIKIAFGATESDGTAKECGCIRPALKALLGAARLAVSDSIGDRHRVPLVHISPIAVEI